MVFRSCLRALSIRVLRSVCFTEMTSGVFAKTVFGGMADILDNDGSEVRGGARGMEYMEGQAGKDFKISLSIRD